LVLLAGLEAAVFGMEENRGAPVVFVTHGRTCALHHTFELCRELVAAGLVAVGVEQRNHGRRMVDPLRNLGFSRDMPVDMYGIFVGTAYDVRSMIDLLPASLGIATERIGMTGASLGGHATLAAMALDERIRVGGPIVGSGDFRRLMELRVETTGALKPGETFEDYFPAGLQRLVERIDPIRNPRLFADRPLLMLNGADDGLVQAECNRRFHETLRPHYAHPERLEFIAYPGIKHEVTEEMRREAVAWFRRWLIDEAVQVFGSCR
jgi:alpha-beta hydrolase superfamily lysophospholipase